MSKRKLRRGETRPRYQDRYNAEDAATYRPRGTKEQVRRRIEREAATYETAADALAVVRQSNEAVYHVLAELLSRMMAVETEHARLGEDVAQLDAAVEGEADAREALARKVYQMDEQWREARRGAKPHLRLEPTVSGPIKPRPANLCEDAPDDVLTIGGRRAK